MHYKDYFLMRSTTISGPGFDNLLELKFKAEIQRHKV